MKRIGSLVRMTRVLGTVVLLGAFATAMGHAQACRTALTAPEQAQLDTTVKFFVHRSGAPGTLRYRDTEFMWDSLYATGLSTQVITTLRKFGTNLAEQTGRLAGGDRRPQHRGGL